MLPSADSHGCFLEVKMPCVCEELKMWNKTAPSKSGSLKQDWFSGKCLCCVTVGRTNNDPNGIFHEASAFNSLGCNSRSSEPISLSFKISYLLILAKSQKNVITPPCEWHIMLKPPEQQRVKVTFIKCPRNLMQM